MTPTQKPHDCQKAPDEGGQGVPVAPVLASALELAEIGLRVIPLEDRSKKPRLRSWISMGTTDRRTIEKWFKKWPAANLGVCTGGGLIVLDVDLSKGGASSLALLIEAHGPLPPTAEVRTGTNGAHYYFRTGPGLDIGNPVGILPGLDIRGNRGQVVAPPSIHPTTGQEYRFVRHPRDGIADVPPWLVAELMKNATTRPRKKNQPKEVRPVGKVRRGDARQLLDEIKAKFPIPGVGHRHALMARVVGSLVGRGYADDLIESIAMAWWKHFHSQGKTTTSEPVMLAELRACIQSTRVNPSFRASTSGIDHRAMCRKITISTEQMRLLDARVVTDEQGGKVLLLDSSPSPGSPPSTCKRGTQIQQIQGCLCLGDDERYFVVGLIVHAMHKRFNLGETAIKMTHAQLREIIQDRHPRGHEWRGDNKQIGRLKRRFISQPGRLAEKFELLRETVKGKPGLPSEYQPTGIEQFLKLASATVSNDSASPAA